MHQEMFQLASLRRNYTDPKDIGTEKYKDYLNSQTTSPRLTDEQRKKLLTRKPLHETQKVNNNGRKNTT